MRVPAAQHLCQHLVLLAFWVLVIPICEQWYLIIAGVSFPTTEVVRTRVLKEPACGYSHCLDILFIYLFILFYFILFLNFT